MGTPLPYAKLGYQRMDDFLRSIPDVVSSYTNYTDGLLYVKAVPLEGSAHINELVREQRPAKKRKPLSSNYSMGNRFKSFRVSSQVAPNRNFNRNYNTYKPPERLDNSRNGSFSKPYLSNNSSYTLPPRFMKINQETSSSAPQLQKSSYFSSSNYSQRAPTTTGPTMFSNNQNINNNKMFTKPTMMEPKPVAVLANSNLNVTGAKTSHGVPGRAHLIPQLMQPRAPAPQVQSDYATPQVIASQTPAVSPTPQAKSSAIVDPIQNSLMNLKISSSKPENSVNLLDSKVEMQQVPKPSSPTQICQEKPVSPNGIQWPLVAPKPLQEGVKPMTFYPSGFEQRPVTSRRVVIKPEEKPPRKLGVIAEPFNLTPQVPKVDTSEIKLENPDSSAPKISPLARAPRVLLKNGLPVDSSPTPVPLRTPRPFMFLPDHLPTVAPNPPAPVSPLLTRRLPFQSVESESVEKDFTSRLPSIVKPTAVLSTR
jgi:hypothetical protein